MTSSEETPRVESGDRRTRAELEDDCCQFCAKDDDDGCESIDRTPGRLPFLCTRNVGHKGKHVACDSIDHNIARWPKTKGSERP